MFSIRRTGQVGGLWKARTASEDSIYAPSLEKLVERLDPGIAPERVTVIAEWLEHVAGQQDVGQIHHGVIS